MGACLRILVPDATTNYILNPALRYDTAGWNAFGSAISRSGAYARFNVASLKVVTNGATFREGAYYRVNALSGISDPITVSAYVRGSGEVHIRLIDNPTGKEWVSQGVTLRTDRWVRISVSGYSTGSNDLRLYVETDNRNQAITFYVDGAQMERKSYATTYCDGDQPGCKWNILAHGSVSTRDANTRQGGKWATLGGTCREDDDIYFTVIGGLGMANIANNVVPWAVAPGSYYTNTKVLNRIVTFTFYIKNEDIFSKTTETIEKLHQLRQKLIDVFKPDLTANSEPFLIEYTQGDRPVYGWFHYEGGIEGQWDIRNKWKNSFPVRLLSVDPYFFEDDQEVQDLDYQEWTYFNGVAGRIQGQWNRMNYGMLPNAGTADGPVTDFAFGDKGQIYACGSFRFVNANALAINPMIPALGIAYWDGTQWIRLSTGANAVINGIAVAPNGYVYATGLFTSIGGVAANGVAYWDGAAWNAMGTGISGVGGSTQGYDVAVAPTGDVYMVGSFTSVGGKPCKNVARWDGSSWQTLGTYGGFNNTANTLAISPDGTIIYFGGIFTDQFSLAGGALSRVAMYTVSTNSFSALGTGLNNTVNKIAIGPLSGKVFAGGLFTAAGPSANINLVSMWNGSAWIPLGTGATVYTGTTISSLSVAPNDDVIVVGQFTNIGGVDAKGFALWNGSAWVNLDIVISVGTTPTMSAVLITPKGDIFIGGTSFSTTQTKPSIFSGFTIVTNSGSAEVKPIIYLLGPARLRWIENQTTGKRAYFDLTISSSEEIWIDFDQGTIISSKRGNIIYSSLAGSDLHSFSLLPGDNKIAMFMTDDTNPVARIIYTPKHWSVDAVETVGALV